MINLISPNAPKKKIQRKNNEGNNHFKFQYTSTVSRRDCTFKSVVDAKSRHPICVRTEKGRMQSTFKINQMKRDGSQQDDINFHCMRAWR